MNEQCAVWPIPQEIALRSDALSLNEAAVVVPARAGPDDLALARLFADMVMDDHNIAVPIVVGRAPSGKQLVRIGVAGQGGLAVPVDLPGAEGYLLKVSAEGAEAIGRDRRGAHYAIATMLQLAEPRGSDVVLRGAEVRDWPYKPIRMVHLFLPGTEELAYARRYLRDFLLRYKFNGLFLETAGGVRFPHRPEIPVAARRFSAELRSLGDTSPIYRENVPLGPNGRFQDSTHTHLAGGRFIEPDDVSHLCEWARGFGLDVVPEVQSLMHCYYLTLAYPEIAELKGAVFPDSYCPSNPKSYDVLFDVLSTIIDLTGCRSVHIGHDEWRSGGLCPQCAQRDTGELFAEDVMKITDWLVARNQGVWMWGDHLVPKHDGAGHDGRSEIVWYVYPQTLRAGELLRRYAPYITVVNWSHYLGEQDGDRVIADLGFEQIYGNFHSRFTDWPGRSAKPYLLGAEVSSWVAWDDLELGRSHYPNALSCASLLWSNQWPDPGDTMRLVARQLPQLRDRLRRGWQQPRLRSGSAGTGRAHTVDISGACNAPAQGARWDLRGVQPGVRKAGDVPLALGDPAVPGGKVGVLVERRHKAAEAYPHDAPPIAVTAKCGSLIFWHTAVIEGERPMSVGESTVHPRESAQLLGWYEVLFADGLVCTAEIRYGENIRGWNESYGPLYHAREAEVGTLPDGRPLTVAGLEWANPRAAVPIVSVTLRGAGTTPETRAIGDTFDTRPMLLGITAIEEPKWSDLRPERQGRRPGLDMLAS